MTASAIASSILKTKVEEKRHRQEPAQLVVCRVIAQGKRILSITRGFSTADSALLWFIENGFSTCSALIST